MAAGVPSSHDDPAASGDVSNQSQTVESNTETTSFTSKRSLLAELIAACLWMLLADFLIFRGQGWTGTANFFLGAGILMCVNHCIHAWSSVGEFSGKDAGQDSAGDLRPVKTHWLSLLCVGLISASIFRLIWSGAPLTVFAAIVGLVSLAMSLSRWRPTVPEGVWVALLSPLFGALRLPAYATIPWTVGRRYGGRRYEDGPNTDSSTDSLSTNRTSLESTWLSILVPAGAAFVFGTLFVFANPDLYQTVSGWVESLDEYVWKFFAQFSAWELPFCLLALLVGAGLLRPLAPRMGASMWNRIAADHANQQLPCTPTIWYPAFRNTLITLIALFAVYLAFEFKTLWRREFPPGFYYAGYAHEGAAWLTFALALATLVLSLIFQSSTLADERVGRLRGLAWVWSALNVLLAVAVYNRLWIYVGYNGMTRMRTIGFFGISLVLVGFTLVVIKIVRDRSFRWLIQAQLIAFVMAFVIYGLFPVDYLAHRYNASRVVDGYLHPSVMIAVKPMDEEGAIPLLNLVDVPDPIIREGVRAMLAEQHAALDSYFFDQPWHWHRYQGDKTVLYEKLSQRKNDWANYQDNPDARLEAINAFKNYAMQWY